MPDGCPAVDLGSLKTNEVLSTNLTKRLPGVQCSGTSESHHGFNRLVCYCDIIEVNYWLDLDAQLLKITWLQCFECFTMASLFSCNTNHMYIASGIDYTAVKLLKNY
jgi:hypothetical protein